MEKEKRGLFQGEKSKFLLGAALLALLLLRAWQLRAPGLVGGLSEDEIHHNFWLIENQSVLGNFTIWQLQPLLDYFLRLYAWFPSLRFGWLGVFLFLGLAVATFFLFRLVVTDLFPTKVANEDPQKISRIYLTLIALVAVSSAVWLAWLPSSLRPGLPFGFSPLRLLVLLALVFISIVSFAAGTRRNWLEGWDSFTSKLVSGKLFYAVLLVLISASFAGASWFLLPVLGYGIGDQNLLTYFERLSPIMFFIGAFSFISLIMLLLVKQSKSGVVAALAGMLGLTLLFAKPISLHFYYSELYLRIPSLSYSLILIVVSFLLALKAFSPDIRSHSQKLFAAFFVTLWLVYQPAEISFASNARHYSLIALASAIWFWGFVFLKSRRTFKFWIVSLFFLNTHFFALPLVGLAYLYEAAVAWRNEASSDSIKMLVYVCLAVGGTLLLNYAVVPYLFIIDAEAASALSGGVLERFVELIQGYISFLAFPISQSPLSLTTLNEFQKFLVDFQPALFALFLVIVAHLSKKRQQLSRFIFLTVVAIPICFLYLASRPAYAFRARYFFPFYGLGLVLVILLFQVVLTRRWQFTLASLANRSSIALLLALFLLASIVGPYSFDAIPGAVSDVYLLSPPPQNSSQTYREYSEVKNNSVNLLHFSYTTVSVRNDISAFYFDFVDGGFKGNRDIYGPRGGLDYRAVVERFLSENPGGNILFDWLLEGCRRVDLPEGVWDADVLRLRGGESCNLLIGGIESYEELCEIAHFVGYPPNATDESLCADVPK